MRFSILFPHQINFLQTIILYAYLNRKQSLKVNWKSDCVRFSKDFLEKGHNNHDNLIVSIENPLQNHIVRLPQQLTKQSYKAQKKCYYDIMELQTTYIWIWGRWVLLNDRISLCCHVFHLHRFFWCLMYNQHICVCIHWFIGSTGHCLLYWYWTEKTEKDLYSI